MAESFVENDALPEEPRPLSVQNEPQTVVQPTHTQESEALELAIQQDFQAPTGAWEFTRMLLKLSEELTDDNLEKLTFRFSGGKDGLGKGVQERIKTPIELFRILQDRNWLTRDNLLRLQAALRDIGRMDLVRVTAEYAQKIDNVLYFYQPSETVNGYRSVKLHLFNCNYKNTDRNHIQLIRLRFSELVGCAQEDIVIVGLEAATSLILTFHVSEYFVCMLKELLKMSTCKARLKQIGIDIIEIESEDELYHCSDEYVRSKSMTEEQKKLCNVYQQLENQTKLLDFAEVKLLELENEKFQCEALLKSLKPEFVKSADNVSSEKVKLLKKFEALSQRPELASYDKSLILSLLDINSKMISTVVAESQESLIKQMELEREHMKIQILDLRNNEVPGQFERLKRRTFTDHGELSIDRYVPTSLIPCKRGQPNKKSGYDSIPHAESDSNEADSPKAEGMDQHLELEPKRIADKTESESKREHTVSYKRKEDADRQVTETMPQVQEIHREKYKSMEIHDTLVSRTESGFDEGFCSRTTSDCAKRTDLPKAKGMYEHLRSEPKRIADKAESESKREHTVSYNKKEYDEGFNSPTSSELSPIRTDLPEAKGMYQHLGSEPKTKRKEGASLQITTTRQQVRALSKFLRKHIQESDVEENWFSPTASGFHEADSPKAEGMDQHLELEPKRIADKTESESKREHTVSYKRKEDADRQVTETMPQVQEIHREKYKSMEIHDTLVSRTESGFDEGFCSRTTSDCAKRTDLPKAKGMYEHLRSEPKRIADKAESESKREHTVSYNKKEYDEGFNSPTSSELSPIRTDLPEAKGMYQHLGSEPKTKRKEGASLQITTTRQQVRALSKFLRKHIQESDVEENWFSPTASGFHEAIRTDLPKAKGMYQHLKWESKRIADNTESKSKRKHTVLYKREAVTKTRQQIQEIHEEKHKSMKSHDTLFSRADIDRLSTGSSEDRK